MDIANIVRNHVTAPFTLPVGEENKATQLTTLEKTISLALSILIGFYTAGIGGVITFYLTTAAIKAMKLVNQQPNKDPSSSSRAPISRNNSPPSDQRNFHRSSPPGASRTQQLLSSSPGGLHFLVPPKSSNRPLDRRLLPSKHSAFTPPQSRCYPSSVRERRFPPLPSGMSRSSTQSILYCGYDITHLYPSTKEIKLDGEIQANMTENGIVIQQQSQQSSAAAATAMLIHKHAPINTTPLHQPSSGNTVSIEKWIHEAGLVPLVKRLLPSDTLEWQLRRLITQNGPAIVSINHGIKPHVIVVDKIEINSEKGIVGLRDPYHGWAITIRLSSFLEKFEGRDIIQIKPKETTQPLH